jgi:hypothetical protein
LPGDLVRLALWCVDGGASGAVHVMKPPASYSVGKHLAGGLGSVASFETFGSGWLRHAMGELHEAFYDGISSRP